MTSIPAESLQKHIADLQQAYSSEVANRLKLSDKYNNLKQENKALKKKMDRLERALLQRTSK